MSNTNINTKNNTNNNNNKENTTMSNTDINNVPADLVSSIISEMEARAKQVDYQRDEPILKFPVKEETQVVAGEQRIGLPEKISAGKAAKILNEYEQAQQEEVRVVRQFKARYEDMLVATSVIMEARWGFTGRGQKQMSFFGGAQPPVAEDVTIGLDEKGFPITKTVIASSFSFEPLSASIDFGYHTNEKLGVCGMISVIAPKGKEAEVKIFLDAIEKQLRSASIYKGKVVEFKKLRGDKGYELNYKHIRVDNNIVYNRDTEHKLNFNVFGRIKFRDEVKAMTGKSTFSTVLYGPYGSGKTECTMAAANAAREAGQTVIFFTPTGNETTQDLEAARHLADLYGPSLLIVEDIDRYYTDTDDPKALSLMTNLIDGPDSKNSEVSFLMTTNHRDRIHPSARRPGRTDAFIEIGSLDREATERLFKQLLGDELRDDVDFEKVYEQVKSTGPSFIRGTFDRARIYSVITNNGKVGMKLSTDDLVYAASTMKEQADFHDEGPAETAEQKFIKSMEFVQNFFGKERDERDEANTLKIEQIHQATV